MSVSRDDVEHVAGLARLRLGPEEAGALTGDLNRILEHVEALEEAPLSAEEEGGPAPPVEPRTRQGREGLPDPLRRSPAELAPRWRDDFFVVPRLPALGGEADVEDPG